MAARRKRAKKHTTVTQCDRCQVVYCRQENECARLECEAYARGGRYWCEDFNPPWHERVSAG